MRLLTQVPGNRQVSVVLRVPSSASIVFRPVIDNSMMLPYSTCSTLAILIASPSTASCGVTATGSDFTTILRLVFADAADAALGSVVPISNLSPICIPDSVSVAGLLVLCCPLPVAIDDADFISNLLLGFVSGSIGLSLKSRAAGSGSGIGPEVLSLLFFLCSLLCISSPIFLLLATFSETFFNSNTLQRSE